jgi:hypothetical protein
MHTSHHVTKAENKKAALEKGGLENLAERPFGSAL